MANINIVSFILY